MIHFTRIARSPEVLLLALSCLAAIAVVVIVETQHLTPVLAATDQKRMHKEAMVTFTEDGELMQPKGYREWVYVGTPLTPNDMNDGQAAFPEFHTVYIDPVSYKEYASTGKFPNGTVLVKELVSVGSKSATSGKGYFMGEFIGLEVAVKDAKRFADEPGNWAYFSFGHEYPLKAQTTAQLVANCNTCHGASAATDYVFTQYYPVLGAAGKSSSGK